MFDLLIQNGLIADGSGAPAFRGDVAIQNGKIAAVADHIESGAERVFDADGRCVAPGFIDIHRHADIALFRPGFGEAELRQGLTTIVNGNCGLSAVPCPPPYRDEILEFLRPVIGKAGPEQSFSSFPEYMAAADAHPLPLNVGMLVGNGTVRAAVKGYDPSPMTDAELERAKALLRQALDAGALGVSLGLVYAPENCYTFEELTRVLAVAGEYGVPLVTHIRGEGDLFHESLREAAALAESAGAPLHVSHLKCIGKRNWGHGVTGALEILEGARASGTRVDYDAYPYTAGSTQLIQILPPEFLEGGAPEIVRRMRDPDCRKKLAEILPHPQPYFENLVSSIGWENIRCTSMARPQNQGYINRSIAEIAAMRGQDPCECVCDLLAEEDCNIAMVDFITCEDDIRRILRDPYTSVISDSVYPDDGVPHPRLFGAFPRILQKYVREEKTLTLEEAVRKMTSAPAAVYGLPGKGLLRVGGDADVTVFDPETVGTRADYIEPRRYGEGFCLVVVNGEIAVERDRVTGARPGRLLRRRPAPPHMENLSFVQQFTGQSPCYECIIQENSAINAESGGITNV